jgi:beta-galactosidase
MRWIIVLLSMLVMASCKRGSEGDKQSVLQSKNAGSITLPTYWKDPKVFEFHREASRTDFYPFENTSLADAGMMQNSDRYESLNGFWKHKYFSGPEEVPAGVESQAFASLAWSETPVPSCMELKGFGVPLFRYHRLPDGFHFPYPPEKDNGVQVFKRTFKVKDTWKDMDVFVNFEGVSSGFFVYVNGLLAGYSEDSRAGSEFHITPYLKPDQNEITVVAFRYCDGNYFESHAQWFLSGIFRKSFLVARPKTRIKDFYAKTGLKDAYKTGTLDLDVLVHNNLAESRKMSIQVSLVDESKSEVFKTIKAIEVPKEAEQSYNFKTDIRSVKAWSDEMPGLYNLQISLMESDKIVEVLQYPIGFRQYEVKNGVFLANGKPVKLHGVWKNEHHAASAYTLQPADIENEADLMKLNNINAAMPAQGSADPHWYKTLQKFGIYILDQANIDLAGVDSSRTELISRAYYSEAFLFRIKNMFERNKNRCNIIAWSLGRNCGEGDNLIKASTWLKEQNKTALVCIDDEGSSFGDIILGPAKTAFSNYGKPYLIQPMASAFGNALGDLEPLWQRTLSAPSVMGGFIDSWNEQSLVRLNQRNASYYAYGGEYGEASDSFLCVRGLMSSDFKAGPCFNGFKNAFKPFLIKAIDLEKGVFEISNLLQFKIADNYHLFYTVEEEGRVRKEAKIEDYPSKPAEKKRVKIDYQTDNVAPGSDYYIKFSLQELTTSRGMQRMLNPGVEQFKLPLYQAALRADYKAYPELKLDETGGEILVSSPYFSASVSRKNGFISTMKVGPQAMIENALTPMLWRVPTLSDRYCGRAAEQAALRHIADAPAVREIKVIEKSAEIVKLRVESTLPLASNAPMVIEYAFHKSGDMSIVLKLDWSLAKDLPEPERLGWFVNTPFNLSRTDWFGFGPSDTYADRTTGMTMGLYSQAVKKNYIPYSVPEEGGNKSGVKWATLTTFEDKVWKISSDEPFHINHMAIDYYALAGTTRSAFEIPYSRNNSLILSAFLADLGDGQSCESVRSLNQKDRKYEYSFYFSLYDERNDPIKNRWNYFLLQKKQNL